MHKEKKNIPRIILSPGEPAGIGPDLIIQIAQQHWPAELIVVGDPDLFAQRAKLLRLPLQLSEFNFTHAAASHLKSTLKIIPVQLSHPCVVGKLDKGNSSYVISCLEKAAEYCFKKNADALVTGPIHKSIINDAGIAFSGHTEFLAQMFDCEVVMLFVTPQMKVALATTHLPLAKVSQAITPALLTQSLRILHQDLIKFFQCMHPKILVCGLNPHAGENGYLGHEEIEIIRPVIDKLRTENMNIIGPLPADTIFTEHHLKTADAILAMYHDQALPVVKYAGFNQAVNVTLGLPIIRTSVDHGTAIDLAGTEQADAGSLSAAVELAMSLV